jgi:DNA-binding NtrC family response regulator
MKTSDFFVGDRAGRPHSDASSTNGRSAGSSSPLTVLLVDDNPHVAESLSLALRLGGHALDRAEGPETALSRLAERRYDAILLDLNYAPGRTDGEEGMALLSRILAGDPEACIVVITAHSGVRIAVEAMRAGARDFVMKPWRNADLLAKLRAAAARRGMVGASHVEPASEPARLIGESEAILRVTDLVRRIGPTMASVVVTGASGTGRTRVASALHAASPRADESMIRIDLRDKDAWSRIDNGRGTLLLRHPDRLDAVDQARLLDLLPRTVRCIAVTGDAQAIEPSLARRIATVEIAVPSLADRGGDALLLVRHFARIAAERHGRPVPRLTSAAEAAVLRTVWPDEVRGLSAAVERAVLLGDGDTIDPAILLPVVSASYVPSAESTAPSRFDLEENERGMVEAALREHHYNVTQAATALGVSRGALYRRMERYGL